MPQRQAVHLPNPELRGVVDHFIEDKRYYASRKTILFYEDMVRRPLLGFLEGHGVESVSAVTPPIIVAYLNQERPHLAQATFAARFSAAKHFFNWCVEQGYAPTSPMAKMRRPRLSKEGRVAFSREEILRMVKVCEQKPGINGHRDRALLLLLLGTGARAEEVENLTVETIDWPHRQLWLNGKGDKTRPVNMGPKLAAALRTWLRERRRWGLQDGGPVFWTQRRQPMTYSAIEWFVRSLGQYAGVEKCHPHRFRHTFATEYFRQHRNLLAVQEALGHEKIETTMTYLRQLHLDYRTNLRLATPEEWLLS
jgi:integrase/recombinase XerD